MILLDCINNSCSQLCSADTLLKIAIAVAFAIVFIQSGVDKLMNPKENLDWLKSHFGKSVLKNTVPLLFFTLTILETVSGLLNVAGVVWILGWDCFSVLYSAFIFNIFTLLCLLLGQRMAKDYAGAVVIISYLILATIGLYLFV